MSADHPGERVPVRVLGTQQPAVVTGSGNVPAGDRRLGGPAVVPSSVVEATAS